jgi:hypothetical protein
LISARKEVDVVALTLHAAPGAELRLEDVTGANLLLSDLRVGYLLLSELRYRAMARAFGLSRSQANLATLAALLTLAEAAHDRAGSYLRAPGAPSALSSSVGAAGVSAVLRSVAGAPSSDVPGAGALLAIAVLGGAVAPTVIRSLHGVRTESHRLALDFHHRYGYLIDPGHWRQRRAHRRGEAPAPLSRSRRSPMASSV